MCPLAINFIGSAFGIGAGNADTKFAATYFQSLLNKQDTHFAYHWHKTISELDNSNLAKHTHLAILNQNLAYLTQQLANQRYIPVNIGGDHSCAIGMWSGISTALNNNHNLGLIWIDAHLDAHTPTTSPTGNIHGMPAAALLGYGHQQLTYILNKNPKLKPHNLCYIGIRSYEMREHELLKNLGVKIFYIEDVIKYGFKKILSKAFDLLLKTTSSIGLTIDLDGLDPSDAPGVGTPVSNGIKANEFISAIKELPIPKLVGLEIVEYNPTLDINNQTAQLMLQIISALKPYVVGSATSQY